MKQAEAFLDGEGREWFKRNHMKLPVADDPVIESIKKLGLNPRTVFEVGCANGWRLKAMENTFNCLAHGCDPYPGEKQAKGTAEKLPVTGKYDMVIYGWCLYLCDREDLFKIVAEGDRILADKGHLVIYDFSTAVPYKRKYKHREGLFSYKMDYSRLWLANPSYHLVSWNLFGTGDDTTSVTVLQKDISNGWPLLNDKANEI